MSIHALFEKPIPHHNLNNNIIAAAEQACLLPSMERGPTDDNDMRRLAAHWPDLRHRRPPARSLLQPIGARRGTAAGPPGGRQATPRRSERQEASVKEGREGGERTHLVDTHAAFSRRFPHNVMQRRNCRRRSFLFEAKGNSWYFAWWKMNRQGHMAMPWTN